MTDVGQPPRPPRGGGGGGEGGRAKESTTAQKQSPGPIYLSETFKLPTSERTVKRYQKLELQPDTGQWKSSLVSEQEATRHGGAAVVEKTPADGPRRFHHHPAKQHLPADEYVGFLEDRIKSRGQRQRRLTQAVGKDGKLYKANHEEALASGLPIVPKAKGWYTWHIRAGLRHEDPQIRATQRAFAAEHKLRVRQRHAGSLSFARSTYVLGSGQPSSTWTEPPPPSATTPTRRTTTTTAKSVQPHPATHDDVPVRGRRELEAAILPELAMLGRRRTSIRDESDDDRVDEDEYKSDRDDEDRDDEDLDDAEPVTTQKIWQRSLRPVRVQASDDDDEPRSAPWRDDEPRSQQWHNDDEPRSQRWRDDEPASPQRHAKTRHRPREGNHRPADREQDWAQFEEQEEEEEELSDASVTTTSTSSSQEDGTDGSSSSSDDDGAAR